MKAFDAGDYERRVIRPMRSRAGALPDNLLERYDVDLAMDAAQLAARLKAVRGKP